MRERKKVILLRKKAGTGILVLLFLASVMLSACIEPPPEIFVEVSPQVVKSGDDITVNGWIDPPQRTKLLIAGKYEVYTREDGTYSKTLRTKPQISKGKHEITVKAPDLGVVGSASYYVLPPRVTPTPTPVPPIITRVTPTPTHWDWDDERLFIDPTPTPVPTHVPVPIIASKVIHTSEEGTVEHPSGAKIYVPIGAVPENAAGEEGELPFTIKESTFGDLGIPSTPPSPTMVPVGNIYCMGPEGFTFKRPIRVTMPLPGGIDYTQYQALMFDYDPATEKWICRGGRVNDDGNALTADVMHLCINYVFLIPKEEAWGALEFDSYYDYTFYGCIDKYTPKGGSGLFGGYTEEFVASEHHCWISSSRSTRGKTRWILPQGTYKLQFEVSTVGEWGKWPESKGYFERTVTIDQPYLCSAGGSCSGEIPVGLQTTNLIPGRPSCLGIPSITGGVGEINVRLNWNADADLDLWVIDPSGEKIFYGNNFSESRGELDLDNRCYDFVPPGRPENIFWKSNPPRGTYKVYVDYFGDCGNGGAVYYTVTWLVSGNAYSKSGTIQPPSEGGAEGDEVLVTTFEY